MSTKQRDYNSYIGTAYRGKIQHHFYKDMRTGDYYISLNDRTPCITDEIREFGIIRAIRRAITLITMQPGCMYTIKFDSLCDDSFIS